MALPFYRSLLKLKTPGSKYAEQVLSVKYHHHYHCNTGVGCLPYQQRILWHPPQEFHYPCSLFVSPATNFMISPPGGRTPPRLTNVTPKVANAHASHTCIVSGHERNIYCRQSVVATNGNDLAKNVVVTNESFPHQKGSARKWHTKF